MTEIFTDFPETWQELWSQKGFEEASPIQKKVFDPLKDGENLVGISPTGSGKTLAYLLPLLTRVKKEGGSQLLILTSSQELAIQVAEVAREWAAAIGLKTLSLIGGANVKRQVEGLKKKPEVVIGTPGRVLELMKSRKLKAHLLQSILLDESDQLLEEANTELIRQILTFSPEEQQVAFFSATADRALPVIHQLIGEAIPVIDATAEDDSREKLTHFYMSVPARKKEEFLRRLAYVKGFQGLVFFNQLGELGTAEEKLVYRGVPVMSLASDQNKLMRKAALTQFREKKLVELLTTDVAARGLDITDLKFVINTEVPMTKESYLHRSGRTGRMGKEGQVITFVQDNTIRDLKRMAKDLKITINEIFIHGGELVTSLPEKDKEVNIKKKVDEKPIIKREKTISNERNTELEKSKPKVKNRKKKQKNKGARRK